MPMASKSRSRSRSRTRDAEEYEETSYSSDESQEVESSSSSPRKPSPPRVIGGRYRLEKKIGEGSYSDVYLAVDKISGDKAAAKLEWTKAEKTNKLLNEVELYKSFKDTHGIPRVRWNGTIGEYNIMVLDLLGPSLDDLFKKQKPFSVKTTVMLAKQIIDRLEHVHDCGILYRDIKPHNFLMGAGESDKSCVYLVDFGLAKRFRDEETGEHLPIHHKKNRGITGTVRYSSPNVHEGYDASRRDDLLALGYVLLHFLRGNLPWLRISAKDKKARNELIRRRKAQTADCDLCKGLPQEFVKYFEYCRALDFYARPDYKKLQRLMDSILAREGCVNDCIFDWTSTEHTQQVRDKTTVKAQRHVKGSSLKRDRSASLADLKRDRSATIVD